MQGCALDLGAVAAEGRVSGSSASAGGASMLGGGDGDADMCL